MRLEKKITILVAIVLVIVGGLMASFAVKAMGNDFSQLIYTEEYEKKTFDITEDFEDIKVELLSGDLQVLPSTDNKAHFIGFENEKDKFTVDVRGTELVISEKENFKWTDHIMVNYQPRKQVLYLPKAEYRDFVISTGSGDIDIHDRFTFAELEIGVGSGDVDLDNILSKERLKVKTGSGQIDLTKCDAASMELKSGSGDIRFTSCEGMNIEISTGSGDVSGSFRTAKSFDAHSGSGDVRVPSDGNGGNCKIRCGSGDIDVHIG
ncbi:hypothetical protein D6855_10330 [Butyrivibrio sp. CB08]|uniref:DUF4097 family beta strand repeat-containing protein n=1 Tax=Butyrivibrio sp. CB08 TaxID=2364879 RepID=UPI000EA8A407|nr:DUF4097 family beta strand repeat-containing protein [Butyrivibrio sp. CB08]RKM59292.1 hypothetical protein D6855_10330 [Butyrivibrio sp. CB08]